MVTKQPLGPLIVDVGGQSLRSEDRELLAHPMLGGVIFFARNYESQQQLRSLVHEIRAVRPNLLLCVDQEGGRVQRFKEGFTRLPSIGSLRNLYAISREEAESSAKELAWLTATELRQLDIDLSFAPVLDIDYFHNTVIGDRAFGTDAESVITLAGAYIEGMSEAGMAAVGKHFPGHGYVQADTHTHIAEDNRQFSEIAETDLRPFAALTQSSEHQKVPLQGIMTAHITYLACDSSPAGFSDYWIQHVLRKRLGFRGAVFSDDVSMAGAAGIGSTTERTYCALQKGCDFVLICNQPDEAEKALEALTSAADLNLFEASVVNRRSAMLAQTTRNDVDECRLARAKQTAERLNLVSDSD